MSLDPITALLETGNAIIKRVWPDPKDQADAQYRLAELAQKGDLAAMHAEVALLTGQLEINKEEAKHPSIFVAGWRPAVGWVCVFALAYSAILEPFARFIATISGYDGSFPVLDISLLGQVLLGMLGLGAFRTYEKTKGVARDSIK